MIPTVLTFAKSKSFDFKDPKNVNNIIFQMDAPLESINGSGDEISGSVNFDPINPQNTSGQITLGAKSLHVGNPVLKEHMHGKDWLDVQKFPTINFTLNKLKDIKQEGINYHANAHGKMKIRNVTLNMEILEEIHRILCSTIPDLLRRAEHPHLLLVKIYFALRFIKHLMGGTTTASSHMFSCY